MSVFRDILNRKNVTLRALQDIATLSDFIPSIQNVFPVPVWPYAKTVQLQPARTSLMSGWTTDIYYSRSMIKE